MIPFQQFLAMVERKNSLLKGKDFQQDPGSGRSSLRANDLNVKREEDLTAKFI